MNDTQESCQHLWKLIKDIKFAMFTTRHGNGQLHSRPMTTQNKEIDEDESLWFFMWRTGGPVEDLTADGTVNVAYSDPDSDTYVSVSGTASVVEDQARKNHFWNKGTEAWFPKGPTDPELALVRVNIVHAHYWDVKESKLVQLYERAKARLTGTPPTDLGEQGEVRIR